MGRMLQALKNLEARSAAAPASSTTSSTLLRHLASGRQAQPATEDVLNVSLPAAFSAISPQALGGESSFTHPAVVLEPLPALADTPFQPVVIAPLLGTAPAAGSQPPAGEAPGPRTAARQKPLPIERAAQRALGEPHRRQAIRELADRLRQDAQETGSRSLMFVGVGEESAAYEAMFHVAALLADEGGRILAIDGDLARQTLTLELECGQHPGLSDMARPGPQQAVNPIEAIQPTAFTNLSFLPAGRWRHQTLSPSDGITRLMGGVSASYDLALIDGGRAGDSNLAALAKAADAAYLVVRLGAVEASTAQEALRTLRGAAARVLGCVALS
jgi:Mrp family chromosome partitioning ATPase